MERRVHRIVVAGGAKAACKRYFGNGSGSLMIAPVLVGAAHLTVAERQRLWGRQIMNAYATEGY